MRRFFLLYRSLRPANVFPLFYPCSKAGFGYAERGERAPTNSDMGDACQPQQRNLYQTKFAHLEYRDGLGNRLRTCSFHHLLILWWLPGR